MYKDCRTNRTLRPGRIREWEIPVQLEKDDIKLIEDKLALIESNIRAIREYLDERTIEIQELSDDIIKIVRKHEI